jgi:hypothetical protein
MFFIKVGTKIDTPYAVVGIQIELYTTSRDHEYQRILSSISVHLLSLLISFLLDLLFARPIVALCQYVVKSIAYSIWLRATLTYEMS